MATNDPEEWSPAPISELAELFRAVEFSWWVAGGRAIELAVGHELRTHGDLDVLVLRRDQSQVQECLSGWDLHVADPPGTGKLRVWRFGEVLEEPLHDIWCRRTPESPWSVQLMLDDAVEDEWVSRRDRRVRMPLARLSRVAPDGTPYLAPEVQLFYKSKHTREKDEVDFEAVLPLLDRDQQAWLLDALATTTPRHPWRQKLQ
ncbi:amino acid transporter [Streptomyces sp. CB03238]|uniref:nucleotidyltransferase domain-containing protein n=1 Tax=Streptomyces sp. CB03238 TaxID=1907777 RepID=UPI000A10B89E|nr:amino acid transporter [Streptomyces sp. CB03238]ORT57952.1 amino acid transporter [Streptomyces sp. CB03238]